MSYYAFMLYVTDTTDELSSIVRTTTIICAHNELAVYDFYLQKPACVQRIVGITVCHIAIQYVGLLYNEM